ncbi:MAG: hypothetical protein NVSMB57_15600 [Actinomycetota bacterium]
MSVHPAAIIDKGAQIGEGTTIWSGAHVRGTAVIGNDCVIGEHVYIGAGVHIGNRCKIQNTALIYEGATVADGVFIGPGVILANDKTPRAINPDGSLKSSDDWTLAETTIGPGVAIGAGAIVVPPVTLSAWSMIAAGSVVTKDVPPHALMAGVPARQIGFVCECGERAVPNAACSRCGRVFEEVV